MISWYSFPFSEYNTNSFIELIFSLASEINNCPCPRDIKLVKLLFLCMTCRTYLTYLAVRIGKVENEIPVLHDLHWFLESCVFISMFCFIPTEDGIYRCLTYVIYINKNIDRSSSFRYVCGSNNQSLQNDLHNAKFKKGRDGLWFQM